MGYQGHGGSRGGGKRGGARGGFNNSRGGFGGGGRGGSSAGRQSHDSGSRSSYSANNQQQQYYDQGAQQYGDGNAYGAEAQAQQDYAQQQAQYDQYYQQGPPPSQGSYQDQPPFDPNAPPAQPYYEYPPHADPNGVPPNGAYEMPPHADPNVPYNVPPEATGIPPHANGGEGAPPTSAGGVPGEEVPGSVATDHSQIPPDQAAGDMNAGSYAQHFPGYPYDQSGAWVERGYHDDIEKKLQTLKQNYATQTKKYNDLKEKYKLSNENAEKKIKYQAEKIKKLTNLTSKTEKITVPDGEGEIEVNAENVKYSNKDAVNKDSVLNALKAERDVYKGRTEALANDLKKAQHDKVAAFDDAKSKEDELNEFKDKYLELEKEKQELQSKLDLLEKEPPKSPVLKAIDANGDTKMNGGDDIDNPKDIKALSERKEYYKNKYLRLLEEKNAEQQGFLQVNKRLLEQFLFAPKPTEA